jgi:hypothetical protein
MAHEKTSPRQRSPTLVRVMMLANTTGLMTQSPF